MSEFEVPGQIGIDPQEGFDFMLIPNFYERVDEVGSQGAENERGAFVAESLRRLGFANGAWPPHIKAIDVSQADTYIPYDDPDALKADLHAHFVAPYGPRGQARYDSFTGEFDHWYAGDSLGQKFGIGGGGASRVNVSRSEPSGNPRLSFGENAHRVGRRAAMTLTFAAKIGRPSTDVIFTGGPELRFVFDPQRVERQNRIMPKEVADAISQNAGQDTHPHNRMEGLLGDNSYDSFVPFEVPLDELAGIYSVILGEPFKPLPNILPRQRTRCNESLARYWGTEEVVPVMIDENRRLELSSHRFVKFPERPGALLAGGMLGMNITESWWRPSAFPTGGEDEGWFPAYYPTITMAVRMQNTASAHEWGQRAEYFAHLPTQTLSLRGIKSAELPRIGTT